MTRSTDLPQLTSLSEILGHQTEAGATNLGRLSFSALVNLLVAAVLDATDISAAASATIYDTISEGLAATPNGGFFFVAAPDANKVLTLYRDVSGSAVERGSIASDGYVTSVFNAVQLVSNAGVNLSSVSVLSASASQSGTSWDVAWQQPRGLWGGNLVQINDLTTTTLASGELLYVDVVGGSSPYTAVKAATSSGLRADFAAGRKLLLVYNQSGTLFGPLVAALMGQRAIGAVNGPQIGFLDGAASRIGDAWKVSWSQFRGVWGGSVVTVADLPETALAANECVYVDLVGGSSPYAVVKAATTATLRADFAAGKKVLLLHNHLGSLVGALAAHIRILELRDRAQWDQDEIAVRVLNSATNPPEIRVYQKGGRPSSNRYLYWRLQRFVVGATGAGNENTDVWATWGVFDQTRSDAETFSLVRRIVSTSSNEIAISQSGKTDAMGGPAHGDEKVTRPAILLIDGREVDMAPAAHTWYRARKVELIQETKLYEQGVPTSVIATIQRRMEWVDGEYFLENRVRFEKVVTLNFAYLAMMAIERVDYTDTNFQITDTVYRSESTPTATTAWAPENVGTSGFTKVETGSNYIKMSGPNGHGLEMEVLTGWDFINGRIPNVSVDNVPDYNKVRFDFVGQGYVTTVGEIIKARTRVRLMNNN